LNLKVRPWKARRVKKTIYDNGGNGLLRDRAPWAVFHIRFDKRPNKPLRLRHVHRGYSCGRNVVAVSGVGCCACHRPSARPQEQKGHAVRASDARRRNSRQRLGRRAGMPFTIFPHMLRHGCGYALANAGHDTRALQAGLGHKNIQHTVRYTELAPDRFKNFWR
jgi:integrase